MASAPVNCYYKDFQKCQNDELSLFAKFAMTTLAGVMGTISLITGVIIVLYIVGMLFYISGHYCLIKLRGLSPKANVSRIKPSQTGTDDIGLTL